MNGRLTYLLEVLTLQPVVFITLVDREWYNSEGMLQPQAWASFHPLAASNPRKFEVEPLKNDVEVDPHATDTNEMVSPTGFRVVQEVTPRNK